MDTETLKILQQAVKEGISSSAWLLFVATVLGAGIGAYFGAYLKRKGEDLALRENFQETLSRLEEQTRATGEIQQEFAVQLKKMESLQAEAAFTRELYGSGLREYSTAQAGGLRQAYLLVFEPSAASVPCEGKDFDERLNMALQAVMQPLRSYIGLLDEETIRRIHQVHNRLLELRAKTPGDVMREKLKIFNAADEARQHVKADMIAFRLGLIQKPLGRGEQLSEQHSV